MILLEIEEACQYEVNEEAREYDIHQVSGKVDLQYECGEIIQCNRRNGIICGQKCKIVSVYNYGSLWKFSSESLHFIMEFESRKLRLRIKGRMLDV